jgi:uncharacterized membrane protein YuzA (DUF378 family)
VEYSFTYTLTERDMSDFYEAYSVHSPEWKKTMRKTRFLFPVLLFLISTFFGRSMKYPRIFYVTILLAAILWIVFFQHFQRRFMKRTFQRTMKKQKKRGSLFYSKAITLDFDEDGLRETTADSEAKLGYSLIERMEIGNTAVYLYQSAAIARVIPNRAFSDDGQRAAFVAFIQSKIS